MEIKGVIWHHSGGTEADPLASTKHHTAEIIDNTHKARWPGFTSSVYTNRLGAFFHVGYNTVIETTKKRRVKTRKYGEETAAAYGYNDGYIHICVTGNYDTGADEWDQEVNQLIIDEWNEIKRAFPYLTIGQNKPHRAYATKSCYGNSLPDDHIQQIIANGVALHDKIDYIIELETEVERLERIITLYKKIVSMLYIALTGKRFSVHEK